MVGGRGESDEGGKDVHSCIMDMVKGGKSEMAD